MILILITTILALKTRDECQDFIDKELEQFAVTSRDKYIKNNFQKPWMDRVGMTDFFNKKGLR